MKKLKKIIMVLAVLLLTALSAASLTGCGGRPTSINVEGFATIAEYRGYTVSERNGWIRADINNNAFAEVRRFETSGAAQAAFNNIANGFRTFSGTTIDTPSYQMRRITSGGHFIRMYRLDDIVLFARDSTGTRDYINAFVDIIAVRD